MVISSADTSCNAVRSATLPVSGTSFQFTPSSASQPAAQTQSGSSYAIFSSIVGGTYTLVSTPPPGGGYTFVRPCWSRTANALLGGEGLSATVSVPIDGETLVWELGYTAGLPWVQTGGGNVYGAGNLTSYIAELASPRAFSLDSAGGYPGLVSYGTGYDFDAGLGKGTTSVSSANWLVQEAESQTTKTNWYEWFRIKLGGPITPSTILEMGSPQEIMSKPSSRTTPYYIAGDMTTSGDWVVGEGETVIFIVNGNLTLGGKVNLTGSGFAAFIVSGNIIVSSSVGGLYTSSTPVVEGVYITSPTGTFRTGTSTVAGRERLVAQGIFVAGGFTLQRDLALVGANMTTSSELFLYNPQLLLAMPRAMQDVPITWEEVPP